MREIFEKLQPEIRGGRMKRQHLAQAIGLVPH